MVRNSPAIRAVHSPMPSELPTVWGLNPVQLHDRYWAAQGVCVVRPSERAPLPRDAHLFMLTDSRTLPIFALRPAIERLFWVRPSVLFIRLRGRSRAVYRELVRHDEQGRFVSFERQYVAPFGATARIALTTDHRVARRWQLTDGSHEMWREFRRQAAQTRHETLALSGRCFDRADEADLNALVSELVQRWQMPSATVGRAIDLRSGMWGDATGEHDDANGNPSAVTLGRVWVGAGRSTREDRTIVGPAVLWDDPNIRTEPADFRWGEIEPASAATAIPAIPRVQPRRKSAWQRRGKRAFDVAFALGVLAVTLPLYPLIMLAIWLEDGRPFFFGHRRETVGGREFPCLKFRSMRKDADRIKTELASKNQSDGPQFFIENDPRVTRVGRLLRKTNLDEIPQFLNVLAGQMSIVGPRPSPRKENQCCPAWREARLSVRPGVTGLWQVSRTRQPGLDFQEWIRFDVEYVEKASFRLDLLIILKTFKVLLGM